MACTQLLPSVPAGVRPCGRERERLTGRARCSVLTARPRLCCAGANPNPNPKPKPNPNPNQERESGETFNVLNVQLTKGA